MSNSMLTNATIGTISNSSFNIGPTSEQVAHDKLSAAAAHSALHDAPARTDETRCHKNTRVNVLDHLERWAQGILEDDAPLFWLYGGAGAGKSAIMQTLSERCAVKGLALGSFFFSRSDPTRNTASVLIPTLAYQVVQLFPDVLQVLHPVINRDSLIFKKSVQVQLTELLVQPLKRLVQLGKISGTPKSPRVFLIDGLDECNNPDQQQEIIRAVAAVCHEHHIPVRFLIASRPELAISTSFRSHQRANHALGSISLSDDPSAEADIRQFIDDEFVKICLHHPFNEHIPSKWPHDKDISTLVQKSSSHFIYASTVMKFIWSAKDNPVRSLQVILGLEVSRTGSPFAELDALYHHIFQSAGHLDKVLQILSHCLFSSLPSYASMICIIHEYSLSDFCIFIADMTPLITIPLPKHNSSAEQEVRFLHASLGDFLRDPARSGSLHLDKHFYLASKLGRCIQLLDLYSQNRSTEPEWPLFEMFAESYHGLYSQMDETIRLSGDLDVVQGVLSSTSLRSLYNCSRLLSKKEGCGDVYSGHIPEILLAICESQPLTCFSKRYMEEFLDILQSALKSGRALLGSIILPLIFLGYPTSGLYMIIFAHFQGTPSGTLLEGGGRGLGGASTLLIRVVECIASSAPSSRHRRANLSLGQLAVAIEAILDERALSLANSGYAKSWSLCMVPRESGDFIDDALLWLLPTAGFSEKIVIFSKMKGPYPGRDAPCSKLWECLDEYTIRVQNENPNLGQNTSQFLPFFNSERPQPGSVLRTRAQERESELCMLSIHVADPSDNRNLPQEGNTRTRKGNPGVQQGLHPAANTGLLGSATEYGHGPSRPGSLSASAHGARRAVRFELDNPRSVRRESEPDMQYLGLRPTRAVVDAGVLDFERNPDGPVSKSTDGSGSTGWIIPRRGYQSGTGTGPSPLPRQTSRRGTSRYSSECGNPSSLGHSEVGAVIGASSARVSNGSFPRPGSVNAQHGQDHREQEEIRALREQHAIEMKALRSQLDDSQRTNNILKEENGQLRGENKRLRDGLDSAVDVMRGIESLRQPRAKPEMEKLRLLDSHTRG